MATLISEKTELEKAGNGHGKKTVFVVDDHPLLRQGLALLINQQQDLEVCGEAEEAHAAMQAIAQKRPVWRRA